MREQIGNISTPFAQGLKKIEQACLIRLSEAARKTANLQISVNAISSARHLQQAQEYNFDSAYEFANVLWMQNEKKMAVETLRGLVQDAEIKGRTPERKQAILLSCLVS
jgi:ataxia telangiectasia mutated family protein